MINENSTTNSPSKGKRYRSFSLSSYLTPEQIGFILSNKSEQCRAYAYILHDKDVKDDGTLKEPHCHILVSTINAKTVEQVRGWFKGYTDDKGLPITTLGQPMHDVGSSFDYLTHDTEGALLENKYVYSSECIQGYNLSFFKDDTAQDEDNITLALSDMVDGIPLFEVAKKYGRDFIIHYQSIKLLFNDIQKMTGGKQLD